MLTSSLPKTIRAVTLSAFVASSIFGCGGGGGGGGTGGSSEGSAGTVYRVSAPVTFDNCGERIAAVSQEFTFVETNGQRAIDTTVTVVPVTESGEGTTFSYSEQNGSCVRTYTGIFKDLSETGANVSLKSETKCADTTCRSEWEGTATVGSQQNREGLNNQTPRVSGERCVPPTDDLFYRPSAFECNGNAFVGMITDRFRRAYSVVLRANGFRNDRDPNNPECGLAECSPYKTQKVIELPQHQIRCLGDNGFTALMRRAQRISIKFIATLTEADKQDPLKFEQYCLADTSGYLN
jgi:hypothetical protein